MEGDYSLIPLRKEDLYQIMNWRNEQIFHLRQTELLSKEKQDFYFIDIIDKLFRGLGPVKKLVKLLIKLNFNKIFMAIVK